MPNHLAARASDLGFRVESSGLHGFMLLFQISEMLTCDTLQRNLLVRCRSKRVGQNIKEVQQQALAGTTDLLSALRVTAGNCRSVRGLRKPLPGVGASPNHPIARFAHVRAEGSHMTGRSQGTHPAGGTDMRTGQSCRTQEEVRSTATLQGRA